MPACSMTGYQRQYHWTMAFKSDTVCSTTNSIDINFICQRGGVEEWLNLVRTFKRGVWVSSETTHLLIINIFEGHSTKNTDYFNKIQLLIKNYCCHYPLLASQPTSLIIPQSWYTRLVIQNTLVMKLHILHSDES